MASLGSYIGAGIISGAGQGAQQGFNTAAYGLSWYAMEQARGEWEMKREQLEQNAQTDRLRREQTFNLGQNELNRAMELRKANISAEAQVEGMRLHNLAMAEARGNNWQIRDTDQGLVAFNPDTKATEALTLNEQPLHEAPSKSSIWETDQGYFTYDAATKTATPITDANGNQLTKTKAGAEFRPQLVTLKDGQLAVFDGKTVTPMADENGKAFMAQNKPGAPPTFEPLTTQGGKLLMYNKQTGDTKAAVDPGTNQPIMMAPREKGALSHDPVVDYLYRMIDNNLALMKSPAIAADPDKMSQLEQQNRAYADHVAQRLGIRQPTSPFAEPLNSLGPGSGPAEMGPAGSAPPKVNPFKGAPQAPESGMGLLNQPGQVTITPRQK